jgi:hypothetical protein
MKNDKQSKAIEIELIDNNIKLIKHKLVDQSEKLGD